MTEQTPEPSEESEQDFIGVVIVDDHEMVAEGLSAVLQTQSDLRVLGIAGTVTAAIDLVGKTQPDVVIMDFQLPDGDGGEATAKILERWPTIAVIMLTGSGAGNALAKAIEAGCAGFLMKGLQVRALDDAVRAVYRGEVVIHAGLLRDALPSLRGPTTPQHDLTARELEVLNMLAHGASTQGIVNDLFLSRNTVRNHVTNILTKLGAHSRLEAVALAVREGIVQAPA